MKTKRKRITTIIPSYPLSVDIRIKNNKREQEQLDRNEKERIKTRLLSEGVCPTKIENKIKWIAIQQDATKLLTNLK